MWIGAASFLRVPGTQSHFLTDAAMEGPLNRAQGHTRSQQLPHLCKLQPPGGLCHDFWALPGPPPQEWQLISTSCSSAWQMITTGPRHLTHPINRKAKMWVYLRELQEQEGLSEEAVQHIARVAGCR